MTKCEINKLKIFQEKKNWQKDHKNILNNQRDI